METWKGVEVHDGTSWMEHAALLRLAVGELVAQGLHTSAANEEDVTLVLDRWTFPLGGVELSEIRVTKEELRAERENWEARMAGDWV